MRLGDRLCTVFEDLNGCDLASCASCGGNEVPCGFDICNVKLNTIGMYLFKWIDLIQMTPCENLELKRDKILTKTCIV